MADSPCNDSCEFSEMHHLDQDGIRQSALNLLDEIDANPPLAVIERLYARIRTTLTEAQTHDNDPRV